MARPRRSRTPKEPKVPVVYEESSAVLEVANRLIRLFPVQFGWIANFNVAYVLIRGRKLNLSAREPWGKFRKVPPLFHGLTGYDAVVEILESGWELLNAEQQEALVAHELCHGSMSDRGALRVEKHDLEEFRFVVAQWGAWAADVKEFGEQLDLFSRRGPAIRTGTQGTQAPLVADVPATVLPDAPPANGQEPVEAFRTEPPAEPIRRSRASQARPATAPPLQ